MNDEEPELPDEAVREETRAEVIIGSDAVTAAWIKERERRAAIMPRSAKAAT